MSVTVREYMNNKENSGMEVMIDKAFSRDLCDPLREELWRGTIEQIPEEYRQMEVLRSGWAIGASVAVLTVIEDKKQMLEENGEKEAGLKQLLLQGEI